ncbi:MAG: DUF6383 domain-containing protein [Bacteroidales bacterium]|nr:DUF6383 domain-containing protein [Bacteroidales bacterium]
MLSGFMSMLATVNSFSVNATQSVGYKLWDSNSGIVATTVPSELSLDAQVMHVQIKFDGAISINATHEELLSQFTILITSYATPEDAGRNVVFGVNGQDPTILDITLASFQQTAQTNCTIAIKATDESGLIPGIKDSEGNAVRLVPISSIQPTGLALEKVSSVTGAASTQASVTYRMSSIPLVRGMNFLQAQSNKSDNANGFLAREYFTIHSHSFNTMTALTHFTTLTAAANIDLLQTVGYTLELMDVPGDENNPNIKLTANTPSDGEELSWIVYHYPYRAAADRKFELAQLIETVHVEQHIITAATAVLYNDQATAAEVAAAIQSLYSNADANRTPPQSEPAWNVITGNRSILVQDVTPGSIITVYRINGQIVSSIPAKSDRETIYIPASGIYIVRVNDSAVKVFVK